MPTLTSHVVAIKLRKPVNVGVIIMKMTQLQLVDLVALRRSNYYGKQLAHCIVAKCMTARITSWTLDNCLKLLSLTVFIMG